jgi:hypothetical protein
MMRISHKYRYNEHKLGGSPSKFVNHNNPYEDTKTIWSDITILNALLLAHNNDIDVTECRLIYDSKGDVSRCTVWLMDDDGKTIDRFELNK